MTGLFDADLRPRIPPEALARSRAEVTALGVQIGKADAAGDLDGARRLRRDRIRALVLRHVPVEVVGPRTAMGLATRFARGLRRAGLTDAQLDAVAADLGLGSGGAPTHEAKE